MACSGFSFEIGGKMPCGWLLDVLNVVNGIRNPGIFSHLAVGIVHFAGSGFKPAVFQKRAEPDGFVNIGFAFFAQVDDFGIASTFEIENLFSGPAVFVVANQFAVRVGRECGFSCTGKSEKQSGLTIAAFVGRTVHG
jgi:hypothetical protein